MVAFSQKKMASLTLLSIMLPISLLAGFRIVGIISEPPETHTVTVETVTWNMTRPSQILTLDGVGSNSYADLKASVSLEARFVGYRENWDFLGFGFVDVVDLRIVASSNMTGGHITAMNVEFHRTDTLADLIVGRANESMQLYNLKLKRILEGSSEARFETLGVEQPHNGSLSMVAFWIFHDENNADHWATIILEVTFLSEGVIEEVRLPLLLGVLAK